MINFNIINLQLVFKWISNMVIHSKFIYDTSGNVVEVILPIEEFEELRKRAMLVGDAEKNQLESELSAKEITQISQLGGSFDWLEQEPDLYTDEDGEPA
jgi:hypothetical protein